MDMLLLFLILRGLVAASAIPIQNDGAQTLIGLLTAMSFLLMCSVGLYSRAALWQTQTVLVRALVTFLLMFPLFALAVSAYRSLMGNAGLTLQLALIAVVLFAPLTVLMRRAFRAIMSLDALRHRVLVIGAGRQGARVEALGRRPKPHFLPVGFIHVGEAAAQVPAFLPHDEVFAGRGLWRLVRDKRVDEIVVALDERRGFSFSQVLECKLRGVKVTDFASFYEREAGEIDLLEMKLSWLIFSDGFQLDRARLVLKRLFDIVVASLLLLLTLPVTLLAALAIKLDSRGPIFYRQERVGLRGAPFAVLKFRSMRVDAEKDGPVWARAKDNRVTAIGGFLRKSRIDEIPQVINVLKGDMSFIGPRPERQVFVDQLRDVIPHYDERHLIKPGITGWAQVNYPYGASIEDARNKLAYDLYYIKNGSFFLDLVILLQTVRVIIWAEGSR
jgi:sugar transferase (PEP-CTERM system associated)